MTQSFSKRISVCAQPRRIPATVHRARFDQVDVMKEIADVVYAALDASGIKGRAREIQAAALIGQINGQLKSFAKGMLPEGRDKAYEPVVSQPDLWELRVNHRKFGKFRLYLAEPTDSDPDIVVLRFHRKPVASGIPKRVKAEQNAIMENAQKVFEDGKQQRWGHVKDCSACLDV